jgi:antitoxin HicB
MTEMNFRDPSDLSSLDDFLDEDGIREEVTLRAIKSVIALQLRQAMTERKMTLSAMAAEMDTSRAQLNRVLDPEEFNVTLETLSRAAKVVGRGLKVELVSVDGGAQTRPPSSNLRQVSDVPNVTDPPPFRTTGQGVRRGLAPRGGGEGLPSLPTERKPPLR